MGIPVFVLGCLLSLYGGSHPAPLRPSGRVLDVADNLERFGTTWHASPPAYRRVWLRGLRGPALRSPWTRVVFGRNLVACIPAGWQEVAARARGSQLCPTAQPDG